MVKQKSFSTSEIIRLRLYIQQITETKFNKLAEVVTWLGAIQAQDSPGAKWSIALRLLHTTDEDIEKAIADKAIICTWPISGTLHFVSVKDIRWILSLVSPRIISGNKTLLVWQLS